MMANSSLPVRAKVSDVQMQLANLWTTAFSNVSPTSFPYISFTLLNQLISTQSNAIFSPAVNEK